MNGSVLRASVITAVDPLGLGRVKVQVPQSTGTAGIWASPLTAGAAPVPGSAVWVLHEGGDPGLPVYVPAEAWGPWTAVPDAWMSSGWSADSAAYRLGPDGEVAFQGQVSTPVVSTSTTLVNSLSLMSLPAALLSPISPLACILVLTPGSVAAATWAVAYLADGGLSLYGGPWTYSSGAASVSLLGLRYAIGS